MSTRMGPEGLSDAQARPPLGDTVGTPSRLPGADAVPPRGGLQLPHGQPALPELSHRPGRSWGEVSEVDMGLEHSARGLGM